MLMSTHKRSMNGVVVVGAGGKRNQFGKLNREKRTRQKLYEKLLISRKYVIRTLVWFAGYSSIETCGAMCVQRAHMANARKKKKRIPSKWSLAMAMIVSSLMRNWLVFGCQQQLMHRNEIKCNGDENTIPILGARLVRCELCLYGETIRNVLIQMSQ